MKQAMTKGAGVSGHVRGANTFAAERIVVLTVVVLGLVCGCTGGPDEDGSEKGGWLADVGVTDAEIMDATRADVRGDAACRRGSAECEKRDTVSLDGDSSDASNQCGRRGQLIDSLEEATRLPEECRIYLGSLAFTDEEFETIEDIPYLEVIEGGLKLSGNDNFVDWSALVILQELGGDLIVEGNPVLQIFRLPELKRLGGDLRIESNDSLGSVANPRLIRSVESLVIRGNPELKEIGGLGVEVRTIEGDLRVAENPKIEKFESFLENLERVEGDVVFRDNAGISEYQVKELLAGVEVEGGTYINE